MERRSAGGRTLAALAPALIVTVAADLGERGAYASGNVDFHVYYLESTEATYTEIVVADSRLRVRFFEDDAGKCERWIEQRPCWTAEDLKLVEAELSTAHLDDLIRLVEEGRFMVLGPTYGDAAAGRRFYPIEIAVKLSGTERRVIYQAFPDSAPMPAAFARLRARLDELARTALDRRHVP